MIIFLIIGLLMGGVAVVFALQNVAVVTVMFMGWQFEGSLALIILLAIAVGVVMSILISMPNAISKSLRIARLRKEKARLEERLGEKDVEVKEEKNKLAATNAYIDDVERNPKV